MEEKILIKSEQYNFKKALLIIGLIITTITLFFCCQSASGTYNSNSWIQERHHTFFNYFFNEWVFNIFIVFIGFCLVFLVIYFWSRSFKLTVTDKRVYGQTSFGKRVDLPIDSISAVGTSALKGISVGTSSGKIHFKLIKNQEKMHSVIGNLLKERQEKEKSQTVKKETTVNQTIIKQTSADELKKYKELLDIGAITQEEFDTKKKELLGL